MRRGLSSSAVANNIGETRQTRAAGRVALGQKTNLVSNNVPQRTFGALKPQNSNVQAAKPLPGSKLLKSNRLDGAENVPTQNQQIKSEKGDVCKPLVKVERSSSRRLSRIPVPAKPKDEDLGFSASRLPPLVENIDIDDGTNALLTPEYVNDIYMYLRHLENKQKVVPEFLTIQREMTPKMRSVLVDWLVNVHSQFKLLPETLYMTISIMDRFFQSEIVSKDKIQLVGITSLKIAAKFEEIYPPMIEEIVSICDNLYGRRDIIKMEMAILKRLRFEMGRPLPLHFLRRNSKAAHASPKIHTLAKYLMELTILDHECSSWAPSLTAATALYVTLNILSDESSQVWTETLAYYSNYKEKTLLPHASKLCSLILKAETSRYQNIRKKYSHPRNHEISKSQILKCDFVYKMAEQAME